MIAFEFNAVKNGVTELMCIVQISSNLQISMIPNYILDMAQSYFKLCLELNLFQIGLHTALFGNKIVVVYLNIKKTGWISWKW